jgi:hypothetical protein
MLRYSLLGALVAGSFGIIHDQITFSISREYFTHLKFVQCSYANFGLPPRFFVAEIGFLATWWVGLFAGWFLARVMVPAFSRAEARHHILQGFGIILAGSLGASFLGYGFGLLRGPNADLSRWQELASEHHITDLPRFVRVAYIHNASYLGGLVGLIVALFRLHRLKSQIRTH